ncbi:unnamed protein product [Rotaria sp. Silwood2]|nr:unnamed protein product [Rotaria sp. Silwood2]CAF3050726.1 unnamed protein product [Rotaria sp. Silwood2]
MHDDVMSLRRDLLKLLKLSEYSEMTTTNLPSLTSFVLPQPVCSNCNHYSDIDLYREINSTIDKHSDDEHYRQLERTRAYCTVVFYYRKQVFREDQGIIGYIVKICIFVVSKEFIYIIFILF